MHRMGVAAAVAALLVWLLTPELPMGARLWTTLLLSAVPLLIIYQSRFESDALAAPRSALYLSSIVGLWALAAITALAAWASGFTFATLRLESLSNGSLMGWIAVATLAGIAVPLIWERVSSSETPLLRHLLPRTSSEKLLFVVVSASAGMCEELVFRGFLLATLTPPTGSIWAAVAVSSALFGVMHAYQSATGALRAGIMGAILAVPVVLTGSILPSIFAHFLIDLFGGLILGPRLIRTRTD